MLRGHMVVQYQNNTTYFAMLDHLGSTHILTNYPTPTVYDSIDYTPFGDIFGGTSDTTHKFTGKERDTETNLDYFGARYFSSVQGRFLTPDWDAKPVTVPYAHFGNPQSLNLYAYVGNNPITLADPDGHDPPPPDSASGDKAPPGPAPGVGCSPNMECVQKAQVEAQANGKPPTVPDRRSDVVLFPANSGVATRGTGLLWEKDWKIGTCDSTSCTEVPHPEKYTVTLSEQTNERGEWKSGGEKQGGFQDWISPEKRTITQRFSIGNQQVQVVLGKDPKGNLIKTWDVKVDVHGTTSPIPPSYSPH